MKHGGESCSNLENQDNQFILRAFSSLKHSQSREGMAWAVDLRDRLLILEWVFEKYYIKDDAGNLDKLRGKAACRSARPELHLYGAITTVRSIYDFQKILLLPHIKAAAFRNCGAAQEMGLPRPINQSSEQPDSRTTRARNMAESWTNRDANRDKRLEDDQYELTHCANFPA